MTLKLKRILISTLCVLLFVCGAVALNFNATNSTFNASADVVEAVIPDVKDVYRLNEKDVFTTSIQTLANPEDASSTITASNGIIIYPDGRAYPVIENKQFDLNLTGTYTLKYFGEYQGKEIIAEKTFSVTDSLFAFSANNTSFVDYATEEYLNQKIEEEDYEPYSIKAHNVDDTKLTLSGEEGISVNLAENTQFIYAQPIDLKKAGADGLTDVISFEPRAEDWNYDYEANKWVVNKAVARKLVIKLIDCYDSSRFIKLVVDTPQTSDNAELGSGPNIRACTDNLTKEWGLWSISQTEAFFEKREDNGANYAWGETKVLQYEGGRRLAWTHTSSTRWYYGGSVGGYKYTEWNKAWINVHYDYENSVVYASSTDKDGVRSTPVGFTDFFNIELYPNDPDSLFSTGGFRGFTTGEVYVSLSYEHYLLKQDTARVDIFQIGENKMSDLFDEEGFDPTLGVSQHKYVDKTAPVVNVDYVPTFNGGVYVAVGDEYTIPSASAYDINLVGGVSVNAYQNYKTENQLNIPIVNGRIKVPFADTYYIVYKAVDKAGNVGEAIVKVFGSSADDTISLNHNTNQFANMKAGEVNTFITPSSIDTINISEYLKLKVEIVSDYETILIADLNSFEEIQDFFGTSSIKYILSYAGKYEVRYYLSDNGFNNYYLPESFEFTVSSSNIEAIFDEPFMYRHYIKDAKYDFDKIKAYEFTTGKPEYADDAELWISFDGNAFVKQNSFYSILITGSQTIQAKYVYGDAEVLTDVYPIIDVGYAVQGNNKQVDTEKYYVGNFDIPETREDGTVIKDLYYVSNTTTGNNKLQYIMPVSIRDFTFTYRIESTYGNLTGVKFSFTDIYNPNNVVTIYQFNQAGKSFVQYNDGSPKELSGPFIRSADNSISFALDTNSVRVSNLSSVITTDVEFTSTMAYFDIELVDISGLAGITLKSLNSVVLSKKYSDKVKPSYVGVLPSGTYKLGDVVTITPALFTDNTTVMIKEYVSFEVKIGNSYVVSNDGVVLNGQQDPTRSYDVTLNQLGKYSIKYTGQDGFQQKISTTQYFSAADDVAPEITFIGEIKEDIIIYAKSGYVLNLNFTLSDNNTPEEALTYKIFVMNTHTSAMFAFTDKSYKFKYEGTYEVSVACYDADNNMTIKSLTVVIGGGK